MINRRKKMLTQLIVVLILIVFLFNAYKVMMHIKNTEIDHTYFRKVEINSIIVDVAISRKTEIKILGIKDWIRVDGCKLVLSENQNEPTDYFLKGDSLIKMSNSNNFLIIRKSEKYNWIIE